MAKARTQVEKLLGKKFPNTTKGNLQVRNYYQVANADAVYAIATLNSDKTGVSGGTNTAVQLGIKMNKPVYVWDVNTEQWYKFESKNNIQRFNTLKEYADKTSARFVNAKEVLRKDDIDYYNERVNDLIQGNLQYAIFAQEDLNNRQYLPFINKLKENGFKNVEGMEYILSKDGVNPKEEFEKLQNNKFEKTETPILTKNFAGVGTRDIENYNTLDKTTNKWTPRKEYVGDEKAQKAQQAIRDVYEKTFNNKEASQKIVDSVPKYEVNKNLANKDGSKRFAQNSGTITSKENPMQIYVDGSDIKGTGAIGYGAYAEYNNKTYELSGTNESDSVKELQKKFPQATFSNPTMEMLGLLETLKKFATTSEHIVINQDYKGAISYGELWNYSEGSEQRPDKPWNAKEAYIKDIVGQSVDIIKQIESNGGSVKINWVKGHQTGTSIHKKGNDNADRVAKDRNIKDTFDEFNNTDFESRDNFSNFAEEDSWKEEDNNDTCTPF